jgi:hypothetical protein
MSIWRGDDSANGAVFAILSSDRMASWDYLGINTDARGGWHPRYRNIYSRRRRHGRRLVRLLLSGNDP